MDWKPFWAIVGEAYRPDPIEHLEALKDRLAELPWFEVIEFQVRFDAAVAAADVADLRGAASLINGGCTDRGFRDFRAWLVTRGQQVYDDALLDPDSLAAVLDGGPVDGFGLDTAALRVYEQKTGMSDFSARLENAKKDIPPPPSAGTAWNSDDETELRQRFPKLCDLYLVPADEWEDVPEVDE